MRIIQCNNWMLKAPPDAQLPFLLSPVQSLVRASIDPASSCGKRASMTGIDEQLLCQVQELELAQCGTLGCCVWNSGEA